MLRPFDDFDLSDTAYLRRWVPGLLPGELVSGMRSALQFLSVAHTLAHADRCPATVALWRFYAREVHAIAEALSSGHGYAVVLPDHAAEIPEPLLSNGLDGV